MYQGSSTTLQMMSSLWELTKLGLSCPFSEHMLTMTAPDVNRGLSVQTSVRNSPSLSIFDINCCPISIQHSIRAIWEVSPSCGLFGTLSLRNKKSTKLRLSSSLETHSLCVQFSHQARICKLMIYNHLGKLSMPPGAASGTMCSRIRSALLMSRIGSPLSWVGITSAYSWKRALLFQLSLLETIA